MIKLNNEQIYNLVKTLKKETIKEYSYLKILGDNEWGFVAGYVVGFYEALDNKKKKDEDEKI